MKEKQIIIVTLQLKEKILYRLRFQIPVYQIILKEGMKKALR